MIIIYLFTSLILKADPLPIQSNEYFPKLRSILTEKMCQDSGLLKCYHVTNQVCETTLKRGFDTCLHTLKPKTEYSTGPYIEAFEAHLGACIMTEFNAQHAANLKREKKCEL